MAQWDFDEMMNFFNKKNNHLFLIEGKWGLEKESLRVNPDGSLALTPHPEEFGNKIKNPFYTTDFSESQLEIITPPAHSIEKTYRLLNRLHIKAENYIKNELLWPYSMPGRLPEENEIPISKFDDTETGRKNGIYRHGLSIRYGKKMQMISGIHYNFSFKNKFFDILYKNFSNHIDKNDFIHNSYFSLARNYMRYRWLLIYLFGASPAVDKSFAENSDEYKKMSEYGEFATSIRMSPLGYSSRNKKVLDISFDSLDGYIDGLEKMLKTEDQEYKKLGIFQNGRQVQLNPNVLQKESEFYSPIRFKAKAGKERSHLEALKSDGISYIEIRSIDLDPFCNPGISLEQLYFLHVFLLYCLFENSGLITEDEMEKIRENDRLVSLSGRKSCLMLDGLDHQKIHLTEWAGELLNKIKIIAGILDRNYDDCRYQKSVLSQEMKLKDQNLLPSVMILNELNLKNETIIDFGLRKAQGYKGENNGISVRKLQRYGIIDPDPYRGSAEKRCCRGCAGFA